jgi:putative ABC transport system permease protein
MNIQLSLQNAFQALLYNGKRSILTMIGIIIGVSSVITILSLSRGFERYAIENLTQANTKNVTVDVNFFPNDNIAEVDCFSDQDLYLVESLKGVDKVDYVTSPTDILYKNLTLHGTKYNKSISLVKTQGRPVDYGRTIDEIDIALNHKVAVVDSDLAKLLVEDSMESVLGKGVEIDNIVYQIVGIVHTDSEDVFSNSANIEIPKKAYEFYNQDRNKISSIRIHVSDGNKPSTIGNRALEVLAESGSMTAQGTYEIFDMSKLTDGIGKILSILTIFISGIAGISLLIAGVGVMNMMYTSVSERTKEIGIRRAVGARKRDIRNQFLIEGLLLTISSGVIGYLIGFFIALLISLALPFRVHPDLFTVCLAIGITSALGVVFSFAPANSAAKKEVIMILR